MPCQSCQDLDPDNKTPTWRPGDFNSSVRQVHQAFNEGCTICSLIWQAVSHFAWKQNWDTPLAKWDSNIEISLSGPDIPLSVTCWGAPDVEDFEFITKSSLPAPWTDVVRPAAVVSSTSDASACFRQIKSWVAECETSHADCRAAPVVQLPTRVIDVNATPQGLRPFLFETKGRSGRYAALSYVWGTGLPLRLTRATLEAFKSGILWSAIPKTLQDAMTITHRLGLRYIWIDALTIIQDHDEDWKTEAARMANVYCNAYLTIAATLALDCHSGIFSSREAAAHHVRVWPIDTARPPVVVEGESVREGEIYARPGWRRGTSHYTLETRGWTLQELILSRRVIQYTSEELIWHCRSGSAAESRPTLIVDCAESKSRRAITLKPTAFPSRTTLNTATKKYLWDLWYCWVKNYTKRQLTVESDKLTALLGIAKAFQASGMGAYHAGLWATDFLVGLTWYSQDDSCLGRHVRPRKYRAPSWSWAAVDGQICWLRNDDTRRAHLRGTAAQSRVVRVSDTELVICGPVVEGVLRKNRSIGGDYTSRLPELVIGNHIDTSVCTDIIDPSPMHPGVEGPRGLVQTPADVVCLLLGTEDPREHVHCCTVLVLLPVPGRIGVYERVGVTSRLNASCSKGAMVREITII